MAKLGLKSISRLLFGRPLDKVDRHVAKYSLQLFIVAELAVQISQRIFYLSPLYQNLFFTGVAFYIGREIHSHAYYHYLRNKS